MRGLVFDIKRFSVHDGPGVRTTVFLKGCPLRCVWCHNPEGVRAQPEVFFYAQKCVRCGACVAACPTGAQTLSADGQRSFDRALCDACGKCVEACYAGALTLAGRRMSVDEVMAVIREDTGFYAASGGGVTLSGGEPLLQPAFATALLRQCKVEGFHTAVDTCGNVPWRAIEPALPFTDIWLYDVKHTDPLQHRKLTGVSNRLILENLRRVGRHGARIEVRMPVVPGLNDSREAIEGAGRLLAEVGVEAARLLPYHRLAGSKYAALGHENTMPDVRPPSRARMEQIARWMRALGVHVIVPEPVARAPRQASPELAKNGP